MDKRGSFRPNDFSFKDFSLRNIGGFLAGYLIIAVLSICIGLFLEVLPDFWKGALLGAGLALVGAFFLFSPSPQKIDIAALPQPSADVRAKCDSPSSTLAEAVKAYRDETGVGLREAKAVLDSYTVSKPLLQEDDTMA